MVIFESDGDKVFMVGDACEKVELTQEYILEKANAIDDLLDKLQTILPEAGKAIRDAMYDACIKIALKLKEKDGVN